LIFLEHQLKDRILELLEGFLVAGSLRDLQCVELDGLGKGSALSNDGNVTRLQTKSK
jgi:hypothetical protein